MTKVLFLVNLDITIYYFRRELVERLLKDGHEVVISSPYGKYIEYFRQKGCKYREVNFSRQGKNPFAELRLLKYYKKLIAEESPDIIFSYTIKPNIYGALAAKKNRVPIVVNITGLGDAVANSGLLQRLLIHLYRYSLDGVQTVFFQNAENKGFFEANKIAREKHRMLPGSGVNLKKYKFVDYPKDEGGNLEFLFVGRITKDKGIDELLLAAQKVKRSYPLITFRIVGFMDGNYDGKIKKCIDEKIIVYEGQQSDIEHYYENCHAVVLPSYHEGMANVLLEAAATGRPILASDVSGCKETFEEGVTGIGFKPRNADSLYDAIMRFIDLPYDQKKKMGEAARQKMEKEFDREIVVEAYLRELQALSNPK